MVSSHTKPDSSALVAGIQSRLRPWMAVTSTAMTESGWSLKTLNRTAVGDGRVRGGGFPRARFATACALIALVLKDPLTFTGS